MELSTPMSKQTRMGNTTNTYCSCALTSFSSYCLGALSALGLMHRTYLQKSATKIRKPVPSSH